MSLSNREPGESAVASVPLPIGSLSVVPTVSAEREPRASGASGQAVTPMAITAPDGTWVWVNRSLASMLGYADEELIGRTFQSMTHPDDLATSLELLDRARSGEAPRVQCEKRLIHKRGHPVWVSLDATGIAGGRDGVPQHFVVQFQNETERKVADAVLRATSARDRGFATNAPGIIYQFAYRPDGSKGFTFASEGVSALFGVTPEALLRDPAALFDLIHADDRAEFHTSGQAAVAALAPWRWEGRVVLATGEEHYIRVASSHERLPDGTILCDGLLMDVTEWRRTATRLEESEQRYRSLFAHHPDAVFSLDMHGGFVSANPACEATSGYGPEELVGRSFAPLIVPEHLDLAFRHFQAAAGGTAQTFEVAILHRSGRRVEIDVTNIPIVVGGEVVGVFGIAKDLTGRRALEAQLRQAQKMEAVGQLAGGVAHDFNNILAAITGFAELLQGSLERNDERRADVDEILKGARRASGLTRQLLAFSRQQVLQPTTLDLNQLVEETATMLRPLLGASLQIATDLGEAPVSVIADRTQLEQVLVNLALNARDAMPDHGTLTISVGVAPAGADSSMMAVLRVRDTGTGMSPDVAARVFEPFFTTKPVGKGTGLGLATVHGIVQQSGGTVHVTSRPGAGSTFTVRLPLVETAARASEPAAVAQTTPGTGTVLLVEDEAPLRRVAERVLRRAGYQVLSASHGAEALRILSDPDVRVDVLLSDVTMPELGGVELAAIATDRAPGLRVVLMSGYADTEVGSIGEGSRIDAFIAKPFTTASLLEAVHGGTLARTE